MQTSEPPPLPKKKPPLWQVLLAVFVGIPSAIVLSIVVPCGGLFIAIFVGVKVYKALRKDA